MLVRQVRIKFFYDITFVRKVFSYPLPTAVDVIVNFVKPEKQRALRRYLGMVNYYHRFILHFAAKLTLLNTLLADSSQRRTD